MHKSQKAITLIVLLPLLGFLIIWGSSMIYSEILTRQFGYIFEAVIVENLDILNRVGYPVELRVLNYSDTSSRIYNVWINIDGYITHIKEGSRIGGAIFEFTKIDDTWQLAGQGTTWSAVGSANGIIWPFFYHSVEGRAIFGFFTFITLIVVLIIIGMLKLKRDK